MALPGTTAASWWLLWLCGMPGLLLTPQEAQCSNDLGTTIRTQPPVQWSTSNFFDSREPASVDWKEGVLDAIVVLENTGSTPLLFADFPGPMYSYALIDGGGGGTGEEKRRHSVVERREVRRLDPGHRYYVFIRVGPFGDALVGLTLQLKYLVLDEKTFRPTGQYLTWTTTYRRSADVAPKESER